MGEGPGSALSFVQERLWFADHVDPGNPANMVAAVMPLVGPVDVERLQQAVAILVERHATLRTSYPAHAGLPRCLTHDHVVVPVEQLDLRGVERARRRSVAIAEAGEVARQPFDLSRPPLVRLRLIRLEEAQHVLVVTLHHIVGDSGSVGLLVSELLAVYAMLEAGVEIALPPIRQPYAALVAQERATLTEEIRAREIAWWTDELDGAPERLDLPSDRPRPEQPSARAAPYYLQLDEALTRRVLEASRAHRATPFLVLLAAYQAFVARWSGARDLVVGVPTANRAGPSTHVVGMLANTLVLRTALPDDPSLAEVLGLVRGRMMGVNRHRRFPFELLAEALMAGKARPRSHAPIFQTVFNYMSAPTAIEATGGLKVQDLAVDEAHPQGIPAAWWRSADDSRSYYDLFVTAFETRGHLRIAFEYAVDLFDADTAAGIARGFRATLETLLDRPATRLSELVIEPRLSVLAERAARRATPRSLVVAASFTAEPMEPTLAFWGGQIGQPFDLRFAPYQQVFQQLMTPGAWAEGPGALNVLLLRAEDFSRDLDAAARTPARAAQVATELADALARAAAAEPAPFLVLLAPSRPTEEQGDSGQDAAFAAVLARRFAGQGRVKLVTAEELQALYPVDVLFDATSDALGHIPFTLDGYAALASVVARFAAALDRRPVKVIAVDADHTLWRGVVGEDGPAGISLEGGRRALRQLLQAQAEQGTLIAIVSRNEPEDVEAAFAAHPDWPLRPEHIVARRVGWGSKSQALLELSEQLGQGLDTFLFLDDDPVQVAEVRAALPQVRAVRLDPDHPDLGQVARHLWALDRWSITSEDRARTDFYRTQERREDLRRDADLVDFLRRLDLRVDIAPCRPEEATRVSQLTVRTTQFNLSPQEVPEASLVPESWLVGSASDRFGSYGLVAAARFTAGEAALRVDQLLMSCRAMGRGIEHMLLRRLAEEAGARGLGLLRFDVAVTARNAPARTFLQGVGASGVPEHVAAGVAELQVDEVLRLPRWPEVVASRTHRATVNVDQSVAQAPLAPPPPAFPDEEVATTLADVPAIQRRVQALRRRQRPAHQALIEATSPTELLLAGLWQELLGIDRVGASDDFFELGGHSLTGVVLLARVREALGAELPFAALLDHSRLSDLAAHIDGLVVDSPELEGLLDELDQLAEAEILALLEQEEAGGGGEP